MNPSKLFLGAAVAIAVATTASAQKVVIDFDKAADFSHLKTFALKLGTSWGNPLSEKRVTDEIAEGLTGRGWTRVDDEAKADAQVVLHGATEKKRDLNTFYSGGWGGYRYGGFGGSTTTVNEYTVGTLVVDIFDVKSKSLVWRGTASDEISDKPEKNAKKMEKVSAKLFKNFPPTPAPAK